MKLFLIRHAESEHNIAQVYAGVTDSALTNHGIFQISRLAQHFQSQNLHFTRVFSSPLQRALLTAEGISRACAKGPPVEHASLVEKHFGFLEGQSWHGAAQRLTNMPLPEVENLEAQESAEAIVARVSGFITDCLFPLLASEEDAEEEVVAVVSHGITLLTMWETLVKLCCPVNGVRFGAGIAPGRTVGWSNTGYLEVDITRPPKDISGLTSDDDSTRSWNIGVVTVNGRTHLQNTQRTRGGIGSSAYDKSQSRLDAFFQREDD